MSSFRSGDLVVLKSGGPVMTVDTVNTSIFDDDQVTGLLCVWFVGNRLERVRFDPGAVQPVPVPESPVMPKLVPGDEATGDYKGVIDSMVDALNTSVEAGSPAADGKPLIVKARRRHRVKRSSIPRDAVN